MSRPCPEGIILVISGEVVFPGPTNDILNVCEGVLCLSPHRDRRRLIPRQGHTDPRGLAAVINRIFTPTPIQNIFPGRSMKDIEIIPPHHMIRTGRTGSDRSNQAVGHSESNLGKG